MGKVAITMGSNSDHGVMSGAECSLRELEIPFETFVVSAHRTPEKMFDFGRTAHEKGFDVIIAGAGGAAHLPGMLAALTHLPVIGVPINSSNSMDGVDSVLSILQMPPGVVVATVALDGAWNAGVLAAQMIGIREPEVRQRVIDYKKRFTE